MNDLYAAIVHDVKNQLAELSLRLGKRGDAQQEMSIAMSAARRLTEMLLIHKQDADLIRVNVDSVNAADFLTILVAEYQELYPGLRFEIDAERAPDFTFFDDALVRLALANALHNACRFARTHVNLSAYEQDQQLVIEIADDGEGYPEHVLANGGNLPAAASGTGTGLGLYLANRIAKLHQLEGRHGHISLSNANGAVFRMFLP